MVTLRMGSEVPGRILEGRSKEVVPRPFHGPEGPQDARGPHYPPLSLFIKGNSGLDGSPSFYDTEKAWIPRF